jgi:hypothetical protein
LIKHPAFAIPGRKALLKSDMEYDVILIDAAETPIERSKKRFRDKKRINKRNNKQKHFYSGKKKRHTIKTQVVVNKKSKSIVCLLFSNGKKHDFRLFKESKTKISSKAQVLTDTGYQGLQKLHKQTLMPQKRSKKQPITKKEKLENQELSRERVLNENVIGVVNLI